jgi:hypothetical protein
MPSRKERCPRGRNDALEEGTMPSRKERCPRGRGGPKYGERATETSKRVATVPTMRKERLRSGRRSDVHHEEGAI